MAFKRFTVYHDANKNDSSLANRLVSTFQGFLASRCPTLTQSKSNYVGMKLDYLRELKGWISHLITISSVTWPRIYFPSVWRKISKKNKAGCLVLPAWLTRSLKLPNRLPSKDHRRGVVACLRLCVPSGSSYRLPELFPLRRNGCKRNAEGCWRKSETVMPLWSHSLACRRWDTTFIFHQNLARE